MKCTNLRASLDELLQIHMYSTSLSIKIQNAAVTLESFFRPLPKQSSPQPRANHCSGFVQHRLDLSFLEFYISRIIQYVFFLCKKGFLHSADFWDSLCVSVLHSFLLLSCSPQCEYITARLSIFLTVGIWTVSVWGCYR